MKTSQQQQAIPTNRKRQARKPKGLSTLFFLPEIQKSKPREPKGKENKKCKIKNTAMAAV
jgi:hypothetical protein